MLDNIVEVKKITSSMIRYLEAEKNYNLAEILKGVYPSSEEIAYDNWNGGTYIYSFVYEIEIDTYQKNRAFISSYEKELLEIAELFLSGRSNEQLSSIELRPICRQYINWNQGVSKDQLISAIDKIKSKMIAVATGGPKIEAVNKDYKELYAELASWLQKLGLDNPNSYKDLWDWYGRWRQGDLPQYIDRRAFVQKLYQELIDTINKSTDEQAQHEFVPTGWDRVDRTVYEMKRRLSVASTEEQFQTIGMLGREALITIAQEVFDKEKHKTSDGVIPSDTDAKRMLDAFILFTLQGTPNERQRKFAKASIDLANQLTHDRMACLSDAQICLTAVSSVANIIRILSQNERRPT